ncbi:iqgap-related protein [Marasmius crinis-equi]|uniref:Iqgap-related protein n=1 Tax=Marasmius crinis-equi TaxID=585013 RepID=A0ABR3FVK8_9AGAR
MERSNSTSSRPNSTTSPFSSYHTRFLDRTSSNASTTSSLSRNNSLSGGGTNILTNNPTGSNPSPRRWTPSHRISNSVDAVRGKWEERSREAFGENPTGSSMASTSSSSSSSATRDDIKSPSFARLQMTVDSNNNSATSNLGRTPTYLKRQTMPTPIIASPLSPNTTGVSVEADSPASITPSRIHLPSPSYDRLQRTQSDLPHSDISTPSRARRNTTDVDSFTSSSHSRALDSPTRQPVETPSNNATPTGLSHRPTSLYSSARASFEKFEKLENANRPTSPTEGASISRRPTSVYGTSRSSFDSAPSYRSTSPINDTPAPALNRRPMSTYGSARSSFEKFENASSNRSVPPSPTVQLTPSSPTKLSDQPSSSVMFPATYKSSYMADKANKYGSSLTAGRRLGEHLPRIASGDRDENWNPEEEEKANAPKHVPEPQPLSSNNRETAKERREKRRRREQDLVVPEADGDDVTGIPGRLRLSRNRAPATPVPSSRLTRGLWADTQRHHIQAYEYLCHVGEAQQWIEGCLGEELGFGVVEMDDGLRNGVVMAKLVRVFQGESAVKRIYEAPKLDFRHSDNINIFFTFVRMVGLPECFIFELTDLYEKKNIPKVIYCIHALSHLLARRGMAERIGNLLGRLQFSDDQLQRTQKGLKDSGVAMPNFGNVGRELAKEINEEPEVEVETEDERRDRLLLENETSIVALQAHLRGVLARQEHKHTHMRLHLCQRDIMRAQALCKGVLTRRRMVQQRKARDNLKPWVLALQARARGTLVRQKWHSHVRRVKRSTPWAIQLQAQIRGVLQRRKFARLKGALRTSKFSFIKLQSLARARLSRQTHQELTRTFAQPIVMTSVNSFQAHCRGMLTRRKIEKQASVLHGLVPNFVGLQAHVRGVLTRRRMRKQMAKLEDISQTVVRIQAAVRTYLARKRLLNVIRGLRKATPVIVNVQALARAALSRQKHASLNKALTNIHTVKSVNSVQTFARAFLARNRHKELNRKLEFTAPDVVGLQATVRGLLVRESYYAWRDHLHANEHVATLLQAMLRGVSQRQKFRAKLEYYQANLSKVVKIQSLFRAKETREQYRQLTLGTNVTVGTIKNFVHLLDDSEADFQEEVKVERLRKRVVENIRENQVLESEVNDLDVKIALVVQNVKSFEEVMKHRGRLGADSPAAHAARSTLLAAHGDPFSGPNTLDQTARRKLELYQQLFYLLQSRREYLSRVFLRMSHDDVSEKDRRFIERVVLTLFGYGQDRREDYLLLRLFQAAIFDEISAAPSINQVIHGHPLYINVAVHYVRPKQITFAKEAFQAIIRRVIDDPELDLEVDPTVIHKARLEHEEMRNGTVSNKRKEVSFREALDDPDTRAIYIRHLQVLRWWTDAFVTAIIDSTRKMPYSMRYLARETLRSARERFPGASDEAYAACIGRIVYYRYINPAIVTPETFDIVNTTIDIGSRKNLAQVSRVLTQITTGAEFDNDSPSYIPINDYVREAIGKLTVWLLQVADVPDADTQFHAHEFLDATVPPKPIYISPNEIYTTHGLLVQYIDDVAPAADDALRTIIGELDGVPHFGSEELKDARDTAVTLELTNRFADVQDPHAEEKTLWVQAKRGVLAILRVQPAQDLLASLLQPVTDKHENDWEDIVEAELESEVIRTHDRRQPSTAGAESAAYRLEDIRSLTFRQVKASALSHLLELEGQGKISRDDGFQGILNAIANDVRSKHRKRLQRQQEMQSMNDALQNLAERKKAFEEQINSYHNYVKQSMETMQKGKGKRRFVIPFTKQYFHLRELQKSGQTPKFGSFLYTAKYLYEKGILLSIDQYSPRQFDKIQITMSSDTAGVFTVTMESSLLGVSTRIASEDVKIEDLLQAKFEQRSSLSLFKGKAKFNFELFLYQINKKFYV